MHQQSSLCYFFIVIGINNKDEMISNNRTNENRLLPNRSRSLHTKIKISHFWNWFQGIGHDRAYKLCGPHSPYSDSTVNWTIFCLSITFYLRSNWAHKIKIYKYPLEPGRLFRTLMLRKIPLGSRVKNVETSEEN